MNHLVNLICKRTILMLLLIISPTVYSLSLKVEWVDNSDNENGFNIEKRHLTDEEFQWVATLQENSISFVDSDVMVNETYCYRIVAFNRAGSASSDEKCNEVSGGDAMPDIDPNAFSGSVGISYELIPKPIDIEIAQKALYSFKDNTSYNQASDGGEISDINFDINEDKVRFYNSDYFSFQNEGAEIANGFAHIAFNSGNNLSFVLHADGAKKTARLYFKAGIWSHDQSNIIVTAGDKVEVLSLVKGYRWYYFAVDIIFDGTAPVHIRPDSDRAGYSSIMFAGIVFSE